MSGLETFDIIFSLCPFAVGQKHLLGLLSAVSICQVDLLELTFQQTVEFVIYCRPEVADNVVSSEDA